MSTSILESEKSRATRVTVTDGSLSVSLADGRSLSVPIEWFPRLQHGTDEERRDCEIISGGRGLHWPSLDEDISVAALLDGQRSAESASSIAAWLRAKSCPA